MSIAPINEAAISLAANLSSFSVQALTEDVFVKGLHSHNDYWREIPFFSALLQGVQSVEADIWAFDEGFQQVRTQPKSTKSNDTEKLTQKVEADNLYVSHDLNYLNQTWTLDNLYLDPLFALLEDANPSFNPEDVEGDSGYAHGVWYGDAGNTFYLFLDTKKDANTTYNLIKPRLQKFIDKGYLTFYNNTAEEWEMGPLTIVLTGNLPTEMVKAEETRYVTLDGKLDWFNQSATAEILKDQAKYSVIASASFGKLFGGSESKNHKQFIATELDILTTHVDLAHHYGVKTRIWEHTNFPAYLRDGQNKDLVEIGSDFLNIDYLSIADYF